jgi:hypothetical protein
MLSAMFLLFYIISRPTLSTQGIVDFYLYFRDVLWYPQMNISFSTGPCGSIHYHMQEKGWVKRKLFTGNRKRNTILDNGMPILEIGLLVLQN